MVHESHHCVHSIYGNIEEKLPSDMPTPLGIVCTYSFSDASSYHNLVAGHVMTGILHIINQLPIEWYCKKQATVVTATYSSEFVATCTMTNQIVDLCYALCMMGVTIPMCSEITTQSYNKEYSQIQPCEALECPHISLCLRSCHLWIPQVIPHTW